MLITILVGLDGIIPYQVQASSEFHTSWNPKSKQSSVQRSKLFAKKAALAWVVDCLDTYFRLINQAPILIFKGDLKAKIDNQENSRSIYRRFNLMCTYYNIQSVDNALIDLLICWRNRLTHFQAENDISALNRRFLIDNAEQIQTAHCGLNIKETLCSFDQHSFPTFKELTSFIRSSINLVYTIDSCLIADIDIVQYADRVLVKYLNDNKRVRLNNLFSKDSKTAEKSIKQLLFQNGFTDGERNAVDIYCERVSTLNHKEAVRRLEHGTFIE